MHNQIPTPHTHFLKPPQIEGFFLDCGPWEGLYTCDMIQRRRPNSCFSPHWCILCKGCSKLVVHLFLHCWVNSNLWLRLFREFGISWVVYRDCSSLSEKHNLQGNGKRAKVLWDCIVLAIIWMVWLERNRLIFEDRTCREMERLWEKVRSCSSLWASTSTDFIDMSFRSIWLDWNAAIR